MDLDALRRLRAFILDMDGVIYQGKAVLPGAAALIRALRGNGVPFRFLTNNSTTPAAKVVARLVDMGVPALDGDVLTSAEVTAETLRQKHPGARVFVIGEEGVRQALAAAGLRAAADYTDTDLVVVGLDRTVTYAQLREATLAIRRGAPFYATNTDRALPTEVGWIPGAGSLVGALQIASDVDPIVIGKPSTAMFDYALGQLNMPADATGAIGDRPETDIVGGQAAGVCTIAVLTGAGTAEAFAAMQRPPDFVFADLVAMGRAFFGSDFTG